MGNDPAGKTLLADPILGRNALAQANMTYPNGLAVGLGDTSDTRVNTEQLELLIAAARGRGDGVLEAQLTGILQREISAARYARAAAPDDLVALTKFVDQLQPGSDSAPPPPLVRAFFGRPLNVLLQRSLTGDPDTSLAAAIYGTGGGHIHANGLAIELYGAGLTMGADPGRGDSYWTKDHSQYYSRPPAHNTVIVNGLSDYAVAPAKQIHMAIQLAEPTPSDPASPAPAISPSVSFAQCGFEYESPVAATQQRTLALVRPDATSAGFYFDVFRSRASGSGQQFHDYLYHNIGQLQATTDATGSPLVMAASNQLDPAAKLLVGYTYFKDERSVAAADDWHARFGVTLNGADKCMDMWVPGQADRTLFAVNAPPDHEIREGAYRALSEMPMPTMILRQRGEAWDRPFIAVYEPSTADHPATIEQVTAPHLSEGDVGLAACQVRGKSSDYTTLLLQDDRPNRSHADVDGTAFTGSFAVVTDRPGQPSQLYLGSGTLLSKGSVSVKSTNDAPISAAVWPAGSGWKYSASAAIKITVPFGAPAGTPSLDGLAVTSGGKPLPAQLRRATDNSIIAEIAVPAGYDQTLALTAGAAKP